MLYVTNPLNGNPDLVNRQRKITCKKSKKRGRPNLTRQKETNEEKDDNKDNEIDKSSKYFLYSFDICN